MPPLPRSSPRPSPRHAVLPCVLAAAGLLPAQRGPEQPAAWNADGSRLLYFDHLAVDTDPQNGNYVCRGLRCLTVATGDVRPVWRLPQHGWRDAAFAWSADGTSIVVATGGAGDRGDAATELHVVPVDGGAPRRIGVPHARAPRSMVVRGDAVVLAAGDLVHVDLRRGEVVARAAAPAGMHYAVLTAGPRLAYVAYWTDPRDGLAATDRPWETGWLDERTLARERAVAFSNAPPWLAEPWPCFAPDGEGFAVAANDPVTHAWEVRVYRHGVQLASFPVLPAEPAADPHFGQALGNLAWARDGRLWVASERFDGASHWQLWELRFDGSAPRATTLGDGGRVRCIGSCFVPSLALSPRGHRFAWYGSRVHLSMLPVSP